MLRASLLVMTYAAARLGDADLATMQLALTIWTFLAFALDAVAIAAQAITGRYLGAGDAVGTRAVTSRMERWGWASGIVTGLGLAALAPFLGPLFTGDQVVQDLLVPVLLVAAVAQPVAGIVFVLDGVLIGAGDAVYLAWAQLATARAVRSGGVAGRQPRPGLAVGRVLGLLHGRPRGDAARARPRRPVDAAGRHEPTTTAGASGSAPTLAPMRLGSPLQKVAMGMVIVVLFAYVPAHPSPDWQRYDVLADPARLGARAPRDEGAGPVRRRVRHQPLVRGARRRRQRPDVVPPAEPPARRLGAVVRLAAADRLRAAAVARDRGAGCLHRPGRQVRRAAVRPAGVGIRPGRRTPGADAGRRDRPARGTDPAGLPAGERRLHLAAVPGPPTRVARRPGTPRGPSAAAPPRSTKAAHPRAEGDDLRGCPA